MVFLFLIFRFLKIVRISDCDLLFDFISHTQKRFVAHLSFLWKQSGHRNIVNLSQGEIIVVSIRLIVHKKMKHTQKTVYSQDSSELFCVLFFLSLNTEIHVLLFTFTVTRKL